MIIKINDLKNVIETLIDRTMKAGIVEIDLPYDYYWTILTKDKTDFRSNTPEPSVGSMLDDLTSLLKISDGDHPVTVVDFDRCGNVLIAVGESISKSDKVII